MAGAGLVCERRCPLRAFVRQWVEREYRLKTQCRGQHLLVK